MKAATNDGLVTIDRRFHQAASGVTGTALPADASALGDDGKMLVARRRCPGGVKGALMGVFFNAARRNGTCDSIRISSSGQQRNAALTPEKQNGPGLAGDGCRSRRDDNGSARMTRGSRVIDALSRCT